MTIPGRNHHPHSMEFEKIQQYLWTTIDRIITIIAEKTNTQEWPHHRLACKKYWSVNPHTRISHVMTMAFDGAQPKIEYPVLFYGKNSANTDIGSGRLVKQHHRIIMMTENCSISSSSSSSSWRRYNLFFNGNVIIYLYFLACFFSSFYSGFVNCLRLPRAISVFLWARAGKEVRFFIVPKTWENQVNFSFFHWVCVQICCVIVIIRRRTIITSQHFTRSTALSVDETPYL